MQWRTLSSEEVYKTPWIRVRRDEVLTHNKKQLTYSVVESTSPSVFIVATNARGDILMQQGYKYPVDKVIWEIPAGHADNDDLLAAAKRELLKETGYTTDDWEELGQTYPALALANFRLRCFGPKTCASRPTNWTKTRQSKDTHL